MTKDQQLEAQADGLLRLHGGFSPQNPERSYTERRLAQRGLEQELYYASSAEFTNSLEAEFYQNTTKEIKDLCRFARISEQDAMIFYWHFVGLSGQDIADAVSLSNVYVCERIQLTAQLLKRVLRRYRYYGWLSVYISELCRK